MTALKTLITQRLDQGKTTRQIWLELTQDGRVTVTLRNFYTQVDRLFHSQSETLKPITASASGALSVFSNTTTRSVTVLPPPAASSSEDAITRQFGYINQPCEVELVGLKDNNGSVTDAN